VDSPLWQFRYRIKNGAWHRQSTKKASLELAVEVACEAYDLARFRLRLGLVGNIHEESYIYVQDVRAASYGYGGNTQEYRYHH
jgi:hypothetical protein